MAIFEFLLFWHIAAFAVLGALGVVFSPRPAHAVLSLLVTLFAVAVGFYAIGSPALAAFQLIIYAGAIIVLFLFVVMLIDLREELPSLEGARFQLAVTGVTVTLVFGALIVLLLTGSDLPPAAGTTPDVAAGIAERSSVERLGLGLFRDHLPMLLLIGILLTAAADGVVGLTGGKRQHA